MKKLIIIALLCADNGAAAELVTATAFCACRKCCGPNARGITASGARPVQGRTVAASRSIPLGTRIHLEGIGWRVVEDRLARRYDNRVDVYFDSHSDAVKFGKKQLKISQAVSTPPGRPSSLLLRGRPQFGR